MKIVPPTEENIAQAARFLREGVLIGMPTETVYGIAAQADDPEAVQHVFRLKGRPADNPLIVHIAGLSQLREVARVVTDAAKRLTERFWPGPLTVVLPKNPRIPHIVTAERDTVAVRVPAHPVALKLLRAAGPLSAPSANRFMSLSPTRAEDIDPELGDRLGMILDGGPCTVGVESTVVDCTGPFPRILRPGGIDRARIEAALGAPLAAPPAGPRLSPGMYHRHYSPRTPLQIVDRLLPGQAGITFEAPLDSSQVRLEQEPRRYATALYAALHRLDADGHSRIYVQAPPQTPEWEAVWDRLLKASSDP
ncbi:MAG TPA: L-threonylcarbamoyladenylate synthase [Fimbriimonas sp.]